jgi:ABC-type nickel/cobalt efflux system permease component RcnA
MRRLAAATLLAAILVVGGAGVVGAHTLGNFTINTAAAVRVSPGSIDIVYTVDRAEIPTFQLAADLDTDDDGVTSGSELDAWASEEAERIRAGLDLRIDGAPVDLSVVDATARLAPGQGGLPVLRMDATLRSDAPPRGEVVLVDANFPGRIGWREITINGTDGSAIGTSTAPVTSPSDGLRTYPADLLRSPVRETRAAFTFAPGVSATPAQAAGREAGPPGSSGLLAGALGDPTLAAAGLGLLIAFGLGAVHALGPGHGKTLMTAYVVGRGGGRGQALQVGLAVAAMHTLSVLGLGVAVLAVERLAPEQVYPWLTALSGIVALGLGIGLLVSRIARLRRDRAHEQAHDHGHDHDHHHHTDVDALSRRGLAAIAVAGGILPSPSAVLALLAAFALGRTALGLGLVAAFSLGLATTLCLVAVVVARARDVIAARGRSTIVSVAPIASAAVIVLVGLIVTIGALTGP